MIQFRQALPALARATLSIAVATNIFLASGCGDESSAPSLRAAPPSDPARYAQEVEQTREEKNEYFATDDKSPVPATQRESWEGLQFYPVDARFRLEGRLIRKMTPREFEITASDGVNRPIAEIGYFLLDVGAGEERLPLYQMLDGEDGGFFLPFMDATTEVETYPAGRYLEIESLGKDRFRLDFNLAYNPFCAYGSEKYSCPLTPEANRLRGAVRAGEYGWVSEY